MTPQNLDSVIMGAMQQIVPGLPKVVPTYGDLLCFPLWILFIILLMIAWKKHRGYSIRW